MLLLQAIAALPPSEAALSAMPLIPTRRAPARLSSGPQQPQGQAAIDSVVFGDDASMKAHAVQMVNVSVVANAALGEPALEVHRAGPRKSSSGGGGGSSGGAKPPAPPPAPEGTGWVRFKLKVEPGVTNYFTLKPWGGAPNGSEPSYETLTFLLQPDKLSQTMGMAEFMAAAIGKNMGGRIPIYPNELDLVSNDQSDSNDGPFPGRWQYMTYVLPESMVPASGVSVLQLPVPAGTASSLQLLAMRMYRSFSDKLLVVTGPRWLSAPGHGKCTGHSSSIQAGLTSGRTRTRTLYLMSRQSGRVQSRLLRPCARPTVRRGEFTCSRRFARPC